jgi:hypothetical protein
MDQPKLEGDQKQKAERQRLAMEKLRRKGHWWLILLVASHP